MPCCYEIGFLQIYVYKKVFKFTMNSKKSTKILGIVLAIILQQTSAYHTKSNHRKYLKTNSLQCKREKIENKYFEIATQ